MAAFLYDFYLISQLLLLCIVISVINAEGQCLTVKAAYAKKGLDRSDVPTHMLKGEQLNVCSQGLSCCTKNMEKELHKLSRNEYDKIMAEKIGLLQKLFVSRTANFDAFFTELLKNSKEDLNTMFVQTYGLLYQQNSYVFMELFDDLGNYYAGKEVDLKEALHKFFSTLLQKMFRLLNQSYSFDERYLNCVTEKMNELKPFGDVPQKLSIQVKRAFIAARTFVQGLSIGRDVVLAVSKIMPSPYCSNAQMKMMYCPYCRALPGIKPCNNFCMNVLKGCLAHHSDLNNEWNTYLDAMIRLAERLEGPFNIESVVDPIDVKISEAIMNLQEHSESVSSKVFSGCGQPPMGGRRKRDNNYNDLMKFSKRVQQPQARPTTAAGTNLYNLVKDIKKKIDIARNFWNNLPQAVCNQLAAPLKDEDNCWNGLSVAKYQPEVMGDGLYNQNRNPEVEVDVSRQNFIISQQLLQLKMITSKLRAAYNGLDVEWIDTEDFIGSGHLYDGSGSGAIIEGSAEGSGGPDFEFYHRGGKPTWQPPIVQTRNAPKARNYNNNKNTDYYNQNNMNNYYSIYNNNSASSLAYNLMIMMILLFIYGLLK